MLAKKLALDEAMATLGRDEMELGFYDGLPLDNLDKNIKQADALFTDWPQVETVIGNPPFQSKNKMQEELGVPYLHKLRARHPEVPGHADYCVYWLRLAHDHLKSGQRAGLVGTNTIRQNYSREGGLDYIVSEGGTITEAVSSMPWSGEASVHVSIVNWVKGEQPGKKRLYIQEGVDPMSGWHHEDRDVISSALSYGFDVTKAKSLKANANSDGCFQGQTHGHKGFLLTLKEAAATLADKPESAEVLFPYLIANDFLGSKAGQPSRYVIDFGELNVLQAGAYSDLFEQVKAKVLPTRTLAVAREAKRNKPLLDENPNAKVNAHHANFLKRWWRLSYRRTELMEILAALPRYIVCGRVTKRPIFEFVSSAIHPSDALSVFPFQDDYSFGILSSEVHWAWFTERCSTLTERYRYTSNTVFDSFPWPQTPKQEAVKAVAAAARKLRAVRRELCEEHNLSLRELYRSAELPGNHPLDDAQDTLDAAVRKAYGMKPKADPLRFLFDLNQSLADIEEQGKPIVGPGLPLAFASDIGLRSEDCIRMP